MNAPEQTKQLEKMQYWMSELREYINIRNPELKTIAETYISEAVFGRKFIANNLNQLSKGARILEVGAGSLILSTQLVREGYDITALEPVSSGFSHFSQLQLLVLELADTVNIKPRLLNVSAENLTINSEFDFAFSINVMEHVACVETSISQIAKSLKKNAIYRFTCPNYHFPYEPHFNIFTLFNKRLTETVLKNRIYNNNNLPDPKGVWESLNWITVKQIKNTIKSSPGLKMDFNKNILGDTLCRASSDFEFSSRRSTLIVNFAKLMVTIKLHKLMQYIPLTIQPIIDCTITKQ